MFMPQGVDTEQKENGSKGDVTKVFGANTPTVSCFFGSKSFDTRFHAYTVVGIMPIQLDTLFCSTESHVYHLRVYMYQARNLTSMDKDSFSGKISVFVRLKHCYLKGGVNDVTETFDNIILMLQILIHTSRSCISAKQQRSYEQR